MGQYSVRRGVPAIAIALAFICGANSICGFAQAEAPGAGQRAGDVRLVAVPVRRDVSRTSIEFERKTGIRTRGEVTQTLGSRETRWEFQTTDSVEIVGEGTVEVATASEMESIKAHCRIDAVKNPRCVALGVAQPIGNTASRSDRTTAGAAATAVLPSALADAVAKFCRIAVLDSLCEGEAAEPEGAEQKVVPGDDLTADEIRVWKDALVAELRRWCTEKPDPSKHPKCRVVGGGQAQASPTTAQRAHRLEPLDLFTDVVLVGTQKRWHCSGVQVAGNFVLTARHCLPAQVVGLSFDVSVHVERVAVLRAFPAPHGMDAALLELASPLVDRPRPWRLRTDDSAPFGRLSIVGFGASDRRGESGFGVLRRNTMVTAGWGCDRWGAVSLGCQPNREMVMTSASGRDTCRGDSGGPVFETVGGERRLVAITSRPIPKARSSCGEGGIYVRVDALAGWMIGVFRGAIKPKGEQE